MTITTKTPRELKLESTLRAVRARIQGIWDDPDLMEKGPLSTDTTADVLAYVEEAVPFEPATGAEA